MTRWVDENGFPWDERTGYDAESIQWQALEDVPTLSEGYTADLKIDDGKQRVWLERTTTLDGEHCDHHITVETLTDGRWTITSEN